MAKDQLIRIVTTGSVDDGKSTLLGRLLLETNSIPKDQLQAVKDFSIRSGKSDLELGYLLDGLAAEREQGITIDVSYRFFETKQKKFVVMDAPGHEQYTKNMVTAASTADLALILIDAKKGITTQSKRHGFLLSLLRVPRLIVAVNKMDLVNYSKERFQEIVNEYTEFSDKLNIPQIQFIPISALTGGNVTKQCEHMPWYDDTILLKYLQNINVSSDANLIDFRFFTQLVVRPDQTFRGYAGTISSGAIRPGEEVVVHPSNQIAKIKEIHNYDGLLDEARAGDAVILTLDKEIDISRGDLLTRVGNLPQKSHSLDGFVCWMGHEPSDAKGEYILRIGTRQIKAFLSDIIYRIDVNTLHREKNISNLSLNDIARVKIATTEAAFFDPYQLNKATGSFILIDPRSCETVAAGTIQHENISLEQYINKPSTRSSNVKWQELPIAKADYQKKNGHRPGILWLTGLSGSGKSSIATYLTSFLFDQDIKIVMLDGDNVRHGLCGDLGFSIQDRSENIRRIGEVAKLFYETGHLVLCTFISPIREDRNLVRSLVPDGDFIEVYIRASIETCIKRDSKGLYQKAISGEIKDFTGISSPYDEPLRPELTVDTDLLTIEQAAQEVIQKLIENKLIKGPNAG